VDVIANTGAVFRGAVIAEDLQMAVVLVGLKRARNQVSLTGARGDRSVMARLDGVP
jgi:hypothetical protein